MGRGPILARRGRPQVRVACCFSEGCETDNEASGWILTEQDQGCYHKGNASTLQCVWVFQAGIPCGRSEGGFLHLVCQGRILQRWSSYSFCYQNSTP